MASVQVVKTEIEDLQAGDAGADQQLIAVQTPSDDQQLIMVTFGGSGKSCFCLSIHVYNN